MNKFIQTYALIFLLLYTIDFLASSFWGTKQRSVLLNFIIPLLFSAAYYGYQYYKDKNSKKK